MDSEDGCDLGAGGHHGTAVRAANASDGAEFDVAGMVRRARREADLSQRDLAADLGVSSSAVGRWETGDACPSMTMFAAVMGVAGLKVAVVNASDEPVAPMRAEALRDRAGRRRPAHLDVVALESDYVPRYDRPRQHVRVARRPRRDAIRRRCAEGTPIRGVGTAWVAGGDHPDDTDIADQLRRWHEVRRQRQIEFIRSTPSYRQRFVSQKPCYCQVECYENGPCVPECECACEPKTFGNGWLSP